MKKENTISREFTLPFVGREEELQFLLNEYDQMLHAQYRSVWIEAPAGMGKTTLVEEFLKRIDVVPPSGATSPLKPWIVHAHLRERSSNSLASFVEALGVTLQTLTEAQREKLFSGLTSFYQEQAKKIVGGGNVQLMDMEEAITTAGYILKRLSYYFPLVVIIEDIHVLKGEMSFYALRHLQAIVEHVPMLMLFVSRPGDEKHLIQFCELSMKEGCKKYEVKSLKYEDVEQLVETSRTSGRLPGEDANKLMHLSGGNALLLRELLRSGTFDSNDSSASTTEQIIHHLIKELEQLPKRDRQLIAIAGTLGEEFSELLLQEITASKDFDCWSEDVLFRLEKKGIIARRKKILKPEGKGKEVPLRVCVFNHALWWEAARRLYGEEKTWTDKKFAETIVPLLRHEDYPVLTDVELLMLLLTQASSSLVINLLKYIASLCVDHTRWNFHSNEERKELLSGAHRWIVRLMQERKVPRDEEIIIMFIDLLNTEQIMQPRELAGAKRVIEICHTMKKLISLSQERRPGRRFLKEIAMIESFEALVAVEQGLGNEFKLSYERLQTIVEDISPDRKEIKNYVKNILSFLQAETFQFCNPAHAAKIMYAVIDHYQLDEPDAHNNVLFIIDEISSLSISQALLQRCLPYIEKMKESFVGGNPHSQDVRKMFRSELRIKMKLGMFSEASNAVNALEGMISSGWREGEKKAMRMSLLHFYATMCDSEKFQDHLAELKKLLGVRLSELEYFPMFIRLEQWEEAESIWQSKKEQLISLPTGLVLRIIQMRILTALFLDDTKAEEEAEGLLRSSFKRYPSPRVEGLRKLRRLEPYRLLKKGRYDHAKKQFERCIENDDTLSQFDKAYYSYFFARISVRYGQDPKKVTSYVEYSLKEFSRLGLNKRVVFTAEKFYQEKLIPEKELRRIRKKYHGIDMKNTDAVQGKQSMSDEKNLRESQRLHVEKDPGITLRCIGGIEAFDPTGKEIVDRRWGKRKSVPSYHKRIVIELVCASLQHRSVTREELLTIFEPGVEPETLSEKKRDKLNRQFAVYVSQLKKMFYPYNIFIKDQDGFLLDPSVYVDLFEMKNSIPNVTALSTTHFPSALWQIRKWNGMLDHHSIAPGIKSKGVEILRHDFIEMHKKITVLEKQLDIKTAL